MNSPAKLSVAPLDAVGDEQWDDVVTDSDAGWPFALAAWQRMIVSVQEWGLSDYSFALIADAHPLAVMPLQFNRHTRVMSSSGWGCSGPVIRNGLPARVNKHVTAQALAHAESAARAAGAIRVEFCLSSVTQQSLAQNWGVNPYLFFGYDDRSALSQVIDLTVSESRLWRGLSESARQAVSKARSVGIAADRVDWHPFLETYYQIHRTNYARTGVEPHPRRYFEGIAETLGKRGHSVLFLARSADGEPLGFHNSVRFGGGAWYHTGCSLPAALASGTNYLLFWTAIENARAAGCRWYDCGVVEYEYYPTGHDRICFGKWHHSACDLCGR